MTGRRRPMRRLGDFLPEMAAELGLEQELRLSRAMSSWSRIVEGHVPPAAGLSELVAIQPPALVVSASAAIVAQELRLRATQLLQAFQAAPGGARLLELRVVVRPPSRPSAPGRPSRPAPPGR